MSIEKSFNPVEVERRWRERWQQGNYFAPSGQGTPYCIMLPPPNVTGRLHMGHAFQDTLMDILTRYHRMSGRDTLWQCGTDHAGIATQMVVERQLAAKEQNRQQLGREQFVAAVWAWKEQSGGHITEQMRRLGTSVDWSHERFTMDDGLSAAVRHVFVSLYQQGLIYRGKRLVNWDPVLHTALSDLEVVAEEEPGSLWHLRYPYAEGEGYVVVATTRPETMLGDVAVAVHPEDTRYRHLVGRQLRLPLTDRLIPIIADDYVEPEFGSGCVKITPAHDFNDYEMGRRHDLPLINVMTTDAALNQQVPKPYQGLDRVLARQRILEDLEAQGLLDKTEAHRLTVPRGDRSGAVLEPLLTDQWFVDLTREQQSDGRPGGKRAITDPAIDAVSSGRIRFVPSNWDKTYFDWMHNIQDWCISRQLWWGHRIPAWYDSDGQVYVGHSEDEIRQRYQLAKDLELQQDPDVLDTWFSSALWPFSTLGWPQDSERLKRFYPTDVLVTGFDIIFFWVARMIMMGLKFVEDVPFREVYIHGLVRDGQGQKMSKSKGNILDPLDLIDGIELEPLVAKRTSGLLQPKMAPSIERATRKEFAQGIRAYGTDALRFTFAALATQGRDIRFDLGRIEGYRNFCNKLWNAARYVLMNTPETIKPEGAKMTVIEHWVISRLHRTKQNVASQLAVYRFDLATQALYDFTWHAYCDWYLELTKPVLNGDQPAQALAARYTLLVVLEELLRLLHPFMPFISEEIWQKIGPRLGRNGDSLSVAQYPQGQEKCLDPEAEAAVEWLQKVLLGVRQIRGEMNIAPSKPLSVYLQSDTDLDHRRVEQFAPWLKAVGRIDNIEWLDSAQQPPQSAMALVDSLKIHIPMAGLIDREVEIDRLQKALEKERAKHSIADKKLANERFTANAPASVVEQQRNRLKAAQSAIDELEKQIETLSNLPS